MPREEIRRISGEAFGDTLSPISMHDRADVVTDEMTTVGIKVAQLAFQGNGAQEERNGS